MPGGDGLELLADLNERFGTRRWPVVILTGHGSEERAVEAMKRGAQDYISKEKASAEGLIRAIENSIEAVQSEKFRAERQRELEEEVARLRRTTSPAEAGQEEAN
jgi:FixJ family two-component response regulator